MNNTLIYGKSGSGKTTSFMFNKLKELINKKNNLIIIDRKKEYYQTFYQELKNNNYETFLINLDVPEYTNGFNILWLPYKLYNQGKKDLSLRMLNSIYKEMLYSPEFKGDSFWINSATNYLIGLTLLLFTNGKQEEINLGSIYVLLMEYERKSFDKLKNYLENLSITNSLYSYLSGTVLAPIDTRGGIIATIKERLSLYVGSETLLKMLCLNTIKLDELNKPYAIFILENEDYTGITNAIIDEIGLYLKDYSLIIDNADNLNNIIRLNTILENSLVNNISTYYITRNKENIKKIYPNNILDKFNKEVNMDNEVCNPRKSGNNLGNNNNYPLLENIKISYINPDKINLN